MRNLSLKVKLGLAVVFCLVVIAAVNALVARHAYQRDMNFAAEQAVKSAARSFASMEGREIDKLSSTLDALMGDPTLTAFFAQRDLDRLYETAAPIFQDLRDRHNITQWQFIEPKTRASYLRVHRPELREDVIDRASVLAAVKSTDSVAGKELDKTGFALRVVRAYVAHGKLIGYMEIGQEINDFLSRMKAETGDEFGLVVEKAHLDEKAWAAARGSRRNNWNDDPNVLAVDATSTEAPILGSSADAREVPDSGRVLSTVERNGSLYVRGVVPVKDLTGHAVGGLFVLHDVTALRDRALQQRNRDMALIVVVAVVLLGLLIAMLELLVIRRLVNMSKAMEDLSMRLAGGDYDVGASIQPSGGDEIGKFEEFLASFLGVIGTTLRELESRVRRGA